MLKSFQYLKFHKKFVSSSPRSHKRNNRADGRQLGQMHEQIKGFTLTKQIITETKIKSKINGKLTFFF